LDSNGKKIDVGVTRNGKMTNGLITPKRPYDTVAYGGFLLPEKYLLFERSKKILRFFKEI